MEQPVHATELFNEGLIDHLQIPSITFPEAELLSPIWDDSNSPSPIEITQEQLWNGLSNLYNSNETLKGDAAALDGSSGKRDSEKGPKTAEMLDDLLDTFMNGANKVLEELSILGNSHPILAIAIFAFHEVVKLDIARRDNNKKVLVVVLQMQNMLGPMFQLRNLNHEHMPAVERQFHEQRLKELVDVITQDIKLCRSDITHFMNRKFVYKLVLAKGYEKKFASHIETFAQRRAELQTVISEYMAIGISAANIALDGIAKKVNVADDKLDKIMSVLFRNVDTPREKEVFKFLQLNGGPEKCVNDLDLLPKLIAKAGESPKTGKVAISNQAELEELRTELSKALSEDLDKVLENHFARFEKVLQVQNNNLKRMSAHLEDQGVLMQTHTLKLGKILDTVTTIMVLEEGKFKTKAVKLKDPEIQNVWTRMNLTSSVVKAKVFVLTFRDHIHVDNSTAVTPMPTSISLPDPEVDSSTPHVEAAAGPNPNMLNVAMNSDKESDEWVLEYIDVAYVQPIVEAMDEDGSGFISVQEANKFALARPKGMSLLHWIAYWAAGWHINLIQYQKAIYSILLQMNDILPQIHIANRVYVDDYLDDPNITRVEALLRSIKPLSETKEPKLQEVANTVSSRQMARLRTNLSDMGHVIESQLDATTIAGGTRVETWILPLILLLLQHHLDVMHLAKTIVLDPTELYVHTSSLQIIFSVFDERMNNLEARFRQLHRDIDAQFRSYSYGMFYAAFKGTVFNASENILMSLQMDEYINPGGTGKKTPVPDTTILSKPVGKAFEFEKVVFLPPTPPGHTPHPMEGLWLGWFFSWEGDANYVRPFHCAIPPILDNHFTANAEAFIGDIDIVGTVEAQPLETPYPKLDVRFDFLPKDANYRKQSCLGFYNPEKDVIEGTFSWITVEEHTPTEDAQAVSDAVAAFDNTPGPTTNQIHSSPGSSAIALEADPKASNPNDQPIQEIPVPNIASKNEGDQGAHDDVAILESNLPSAEPDTSLEIDNKAQDSIVVTSAESELKSDGMVNQENGNIVEAPERKGDGRFYLTRTPVHLFRFRYLLDGPGTPPCWHVWPAARKRWAFAIEAILADTRVRIRSRKAFDESLAERRKWLYHSIRYDMTDDDIVPSWHGYSPITDKEWDVYDTLLSSVSPLYARIYDDLAHYMAKREIYIAPVGRAICDVCRYSIAFTRHQCITCKDDDLSRMDHIDICYNCIDKPLPFNENSIFSLLHKQSHSLLRSPRRIHKYEFNTIIPQARLISERIKTMFRLLEEERHKSKSRLAVRRGVKGKKALKKSNSDNHASQPQVPDGPPPILCACCGENILLPCWVCIVCCEFLFPPKTPQYSTDFYDIAPLTFFCSRCERTSAPMTQASQGHSRLEHQILRIYDSVEVKPIRSGKDNDMSRQLEDINSNISLLEEKMNKQLEEGEKVKGVVEDVAKKVGVIAYYDSFSTLSEEDENEGDLLHKSVSTSPSEIGDDMQDGDASGLTDAEDSPVGYNTFPASNSKGENAAANDQAKVQSKLKQRIDTLEVKVENIGAKMDTLLNLMQNLVSSSRLTTNDSV
ncbi:hypothetical protein CVT25_015418 [Psilocybe cyanescens]|uniref:EF-hand domain-containing protein n=1 Tax=Psilocybe cyanescens TaxID=93625 RepID=A0A409WHF9_PSICY|nr:hypothetical protein CVT25_015418 [Psilocybe cyanescens]